MSAVLWMNIPLMVLAFGLMVGIPLWMVRRRPNWSGKPETSSVLAYGRRQRRETAAQRQRPSHAQYPIRPVADW